MNPDERSTGALIRNALVKSSVNKNDKNNEINKEKSDIELLPGEQKSSPGIYISDNDLAALLRFYEKETTIVRLDENGTDISNSDLPNNCTFILSDDKNFTAEEDDLLNGFDVKNISLGPVILHTDHCISIIHNHLDRAFL